MVLLVALSGHSLFAQPSSEEAQASAFVPLFTTSEYRFQGPLPQAEFFFQLPQHVERTEGSRLVIRFRASPLLIPDISTATIMLNGSPLTSIRLPGAAGDSGDLQTLSFDVTASSLRSGWNRVTVKCLMQTTDVNCRDIDNPACWMVFETGTGLQFSYRRVRLSPELPRFPATITEEQLLRQDEMLDAFPVDRIRPVAAVLVPGQMEDASLRAFLVATTRLGQPGYLRSEMIQIGNLSEWGSLSGQLNGVLIGTSKDMGSMDLPVEIRSAVTVLRPGEGLVGEFITGAFPAMQRRWIAVCGADEEGLHKALMVLGSADALDAGVENPIIVRQEPGISPITARLADPPPATQSFEQLIGGSLTLRGIFRNHTTANWEMAPGWETAAGSELRLEMSHAAGLEKASAVQFELNGQLFPGVPLGREATARQQVVLKIPEGLPGMAPNRMDVTSYLDIGSTDCAHRNEERAWVSFDPDSLLLLRVRPLTIQGLDRLGMVLMRDAFLRRACVLVPASPSPGDLGVLRDLGLFLGQKLSTIPVLWPQAAFYSAGKSAPAEVLENTSIILLGSTSQLRQALPEQVRLSVETASGGSSLRLLNTELPIADLPPGLVFAQYLASPWSATNCVVTVGGAEGIGGNIAGRLLTDSNILSKMAGTVSGLDARGRTFHYDVRVPDAQSLSERILNVMPRSSAITGDTGEEEKPAGIEGYLSQLLTYRNFAIFGVALLLILFMIRTQIRLRARQVKRRRREEGTDSDDV